MKKYLLLLLAASSLTQAATFNVSTVSELENALTISNTNGEADTITLSEGTYFFSNYLNLGDSDNELTIEGDSNLNPEQIVLDGTSSSQINASIFLANNPIHKISVRNLTIQNGERPIFIGGNNIYPVEILNVNFLNNTDSAIYHSGQNGIKNLIIKNSIFNNNSGASFGGAIVSMNLLVENSRFENNTASLFGGAIHCGNSSSSPDNCIVYNSVFVGNSCSSDSTGANDISGAGHILSSIFDGISSSYPSQPSVTSLSFGSNLIANNLFINNELDLKFTGSSNFLINNVLNNIDMLSYGVHNLYHNVFTQVKPSMNSGAWVDVGNTYNSSISFDANYKTTAYDLVVGKGYDPLVLDEFKNNQLLIDAMQTDYEGNPRILGTIDIGQIEYDVDSSPQITNMAYEGNAKIYNELTVTFDIQPFSDRTLSHVYFDAGDGIYYELYENQEQVTFESAGDYTIYVKAIDSEGEETIRGLNITIADFTTEEAFQYVQDNPAEFSLVTFSDSDENVATAVIAATTAGITTGKQYVQDNLSEFSLVTEAAQETAVANATTTGIATGKQYVQDNLAEFSLVTEAAQETAVANATTTGIATGKQYVQDNLAEFSLVTEAAQATAVTAATTTGIATGKQYVQDNLSEFSLVTETAQATAVAAATTTGIVTGKQYVQDNLAEFSLVTEAAQSTAVASASATGIADGENNVINNPIAYGLNIVIGLSKEGIAQLPTGWKMISIPEDVTDLSIFDDAKIVWFFNNETQAWTAYSSNSNTVQQLQGKDIGIITRLSAGDGVFIEM